MSYVVRFEGVSKSYSIRHQTGHGYQALREVLADKAKRVASRVLHPLRRHEPTVSFEQFWALKDVSFEVHQGERVGIIGRNGAGKSTLLKVLSRITEPTSGRIHIRGRVATLLEVGTGFHPELSGRENIFLNGAILGMTRAEIRRKFDDIVEFAEVETFLDTPVKRYSSGMYVRLAFSVAAHLDPEILVVDEVLAVGDAAFQRKCLGKMASVASEGRTIFFVSHNLGAIQNLCSTCVLLNSGEIVVRGDPAKVVGTYVTTGAAAAVDYLQGPDPSKAMHLRKVGLSTVDGTPAQEFAFADAVRVNIEYDVNEPTSSCSVWVGVRTIEQTYAFCSSDSDTNEQIFQLREPGAYRTTLDIPKQWLNAGTYFLVVGITKYPQATNFDRVECSAFTIHDTGTPEQLRTGNSRPGILQPFLAWEIDAQR